jgi:hypothetical protein
MFLVGQNFVRTHCISIQHESILVERVGALLMSSTHGPPCYILGIHNHGLSRAGIAHVKTATLCLRGVVSSAVPLPGIGIILRDFSFALRNGCRWNSAPGFATECSSPSYADRRSQLAWAWLGDFMINVTMPDASFVRHAKATHIRRPRASSSTSTSSSTSCGNVSHDRCSSSSSSSIVAGPPADTPLVGKTWFSAVLDHAYLDAMCWQAMHSIVSSIRTRDPHSLFANGTSDHSPIAVSVASRLHAHKRTKSSSIPRWVANSPTFSDALSPAAHLGQDKLPFR